MACADVRPRWHAHPMLTIREHMALTLAATPYRYAAIRETHAREQLGMDAVRFWQVVGGLLERVDAEAERPVEVRRLRRVAQRRRVARVKGMAGSRVE